MIVSGRAVNQIVIILGGGGVQGQGKGQRLMSITKSNPPPRKIAKSALTVTLFEQLSQAQNNHFEHIKCPKSPLQAQVMGV